jgi:hypothetical protein
MDIPASQVAVAQLIPLHHEQYCKLRFKSQSTAVRRRLCQVARANLRPYNGARYTSGSLTCTTVNAETLAGITNQCAGIRGAVAAVFSVRIDEHWLCARRSLT